MKTLTRIPLYTFLKTVIPLALMVLLLLGATPMPIQAQGGDVRAIPPLPGGQNYKFTHLTIADGLSQSDVRSIVQDQQGFMWFGTWLGGLNRYDGYTFKVYKHDSLDERSLGNDNIWVLYVDRAGDLWVGTIGGGMDRYDRATDTFVHYRYQPDNPTGLPNDDVRVFYEDESGALWVATTGGLSRFDRAKGTFFTYRNDPKDPTSLGDNDVRSIWVDKKTGLFWLGTRNGGVSVFDRSTGRFTQYKNNPDDPTSLSNNAVNHIFQDRAGSLWISTRGGLNRFDPQAKTFIQYHPNPNNPNSISDNYVTMAYEDRAGRFWVATNNGLNLFDRQQATFSQYHHDLNDPLSLGNNVINSGALYEDSAGALWIGTGYNGVSRLAGEPAKFITYRNNPNDPHSLSNNNVTSLHIDHAGVLWIGTGDGLDRFDGQTFTHYLSDPKDPNSPSPGTWRVLAEDTQNRLWIATYGGGLSRLDGQAFTHYRTDPKDPHSLASDIVQTLLPDNKGGLWIGLQGKGLDYFDGQNFTHFQPDKANPNSLPDAYVYSLLIDQSGSVWIGTVKMGLVQYVPTTGTFTTYLLDPTQPGNQAANWVQDIYSDQTSLWVGSNSGLFRFDLATGTFTRHYTEKDGLVSNSIVGVLGDAQGNVWVSTVNGLSRFDPKSETFRNYDVSDGLQSNEFSRGAHVKAPDGQLFFGGVNGFNAFYPDRMVDNPTPPPVVLTDFQLFNKPVEIGGKDSPLQQAIHVAQGITLRYDQSVFSFQFAALGYTTPQKNRYAYKMDGFDQDWQYTDANRRFATYTNLDPGDYTFRVKASNNDGVWNEQGTALKITITPPWWQTWWFRTAAIAALLALAYGGYRLRVRSIQQRSQELERQVAARTRDLQIAADVSKQITTVLDIDRLLQQVVTLTVQGFDLYVAAIFMVEGDNLKLAHTASTRLSGEILKEAHLVHIPIDAEPSIVALAARTREAVTVNDVRQSPLFLPLSILPETRSELAIPMRLGNQLLGVFDLQAEQLNRFSDEDLRVLTTLADQIAIAVRNAALFTESQAAQQKAEASAASAAAANRAKSAFLANMSHELRTPLNAILGYADILKRRMGATNPLADGLDIIQRSGEHLLTLINDVLDLAKIEAGKLELNPAPLQLPTFLRQIVGIIHARAEAKDLSLTYEALSPLPDTVLADEKRLRQVLLNLLGNAVKFTDQGHVTLRVTANAEGRMQNAEYEKQKDEGEPAIHHSSFCILHFEVEDTGVGIAPEQLERIFQPFEQAGEAAKRVEGTGLGLAISQQIVQLMGGRLQVESPISVPPAVGEVKGGPGSTFWFDVTLPVIEAVAQGEATPLHTIVGYEGARRKVLVADDKDYNRQMLVDLLAPLGFEVGTAGNGQETIDKALTWQPDAIVLDLVMPVKTGFEAAQEIRQRPEFEAQRMCIIAVSASVLEADQEKSRVAGCDAFLPKPIEAQRLLDLLAIPLGLAWVYAEAEAGSVAPLVPPPAAELTALYQLADEGRILDIQAQAARLEKLGEVYVPFARRLQKLARGFEIDQIKAFLKQFMR